ncbi:MAG: hypothetical protein ONB15_00065 [candidate division KSB1 bacterium]|nr:hypothetical protein [candidate division KSB1 bacterium]
MYRYVVHFESSDGGIDCAEPLATQDLAPIVEDARFCALRQGLIEDGTGDYSVRPLLVNPNRGSDSDVLLVAGFEVRVAAKDGGPGFKKNYWLSNLRQLALEKLRRVNHRESKIATSSEVRYWLQARPEATSEAEKQEVLLNKLDYLRHSDFPVEALRVRLKEPVRGGAIIWSTLMEPYPLFMPRDVLSHMRALSVRDLTREVAGFLVGEVFRHPITGEIFGVVLDSIPARTHRATQTSVHLDGETWQAFYDEKQVRYPGAHLMGWWHSHPFEAKANDCGGSAADPNGCSGQVEDPANGTAGRASTLFLSEQDLFIHRRFFSAPYCVCVVVDPRAVPGQDIAIYGWYEALVCSRNAYLL